MSNEKKTGPDWKKATADAQRKAADAANSVKNKIVNVMDVDGNGKVELNDIIIMALKVPGIQIDREEFLRKEFFKNHPQCVIDEIIATTPARAGISMQEVDKLANDTIAFERNCVSGISAALGMPGGVAMVATIPADIAQYYGYMLRAAQKLMYLYGFPAMDVNEKGQTFDSETMNILTICLGVMYGVAGANNALKSIAKALGNGVEKQLLKQALTKGTIYPIVKNVAKWFGVRMTKDVFAGFFKHAIPLVGGAIGFGLTYASFKPCCDMLQKSLRKTKLADPSYEGDDDDIPVEAVIVEEQDEETEGA